MPNNKKLVLDNSLSTYSTKKDYAIAVGNRVTVNTSHREKMMSLLMKQGLKKFRYDGKWVLMTTMDVPTDTISLKLIKMVGLSIRMIK
jgi:hypothetical protein